MIKMLSDFIEPIYEDNHLLVVNKPAMMPVQADSSGDEDLLNYYKEYIRIKYDKPGNVYLGLVHRLDRPVGGLLVFAKTSKAAARLQKSMIANQWVKEYLAVLCGQIFGSGEWIDYILRLNNSSSSIVSKESIKNSKYAKLEFEAMQQIDGLSLIKTNLITGRHHQIRVQASSRNLPIWGDARYNSNSKPGEPIALFASTLEFPHPTKGNTMRFSILPKNIYPWTKFDLGSINISDNKNQI